MASALLLPVQVVVAWRWPAGYSVADNAISDLGVTTCGLFADGGQPREVCSPWHYLFNAGLIASGLLVALGAVLLHGRWPSRSGRAAMILMALAGLCVVMVGLAPWDTHPQLHDAAALGQAALQWVAMVLFAIGVGPGAFRRLTVATVAVPVVGFVAFLSALDGAALPGLPFGVAERLSFDTLTLWVAVVGVVVLVGGRPSTDADPLDRLGDGRR